MERRRWLLKDALEGLCWGALFSILPAELFLLLLIALAVVMLYRIAVRERTGDRLGLLVMVAVACWVLAVARALPFKYEDRPLSPLSSDTLPLSALLEELKAQLIDSQFSVSPDLGQVITLPSRRPTPHQLRDALRTQAGLDLDIGYCGTSATVLWGGYPMGVVIYRRDEARR